MGNIYENGFDKLLSRQQDEGSLDTPVYEGVVSDPVSSLGSYQGGLSNSTEDVISVQNVSSGATSAITWYGKETFTDTTVGKREGVDNDGTYKWIIGGPSSSVDWNVTTADTLTIVGSITATTGTIGGWTINATTLTGGNATLDSTGALSIGTGDSIFKADANGIYLGNATYASAPFRVSMAGALVSTSATITGAITATSGSIGSFTIGTYLYTGSKTAYNDANAGVHLGSDGIGFGNNVFTVSAAGAVVATSLTLTGGTIKYGKTGFTDTVNAGYYFGSEGVYFGAAADATLLKYAIATGLIDLVGTISSRSTATIAAAINSSGNLVNDVINARLDTSAKSILSDFEFDSVDYSGGLKCGTITWNATTGAITGGTGGVFHKGGIVFAVAGVPTITLDGATGSATFAGTLSAPAGTLGSITAGTFTGITIAIGTGNDIFKADSNGIYLGNATFASAPFRVTMAGALTATSATITGDITATTGYFQTVTLGKTGVASGTLTLQLWGTHGDTYINSGKTDFTNTDTGFILGLDDSDSDKAKFYVGNSTDYLNWDGSKLTIAGTIVNLDTSTGEIIGSTFNGSPLSFDFIFGNGSDGDVTISSNTNLTRDMFYDDLTITGSNIWLNPSGFRIFVKGTLTIAATCRIQRDGNVGGNGNNGVGDTRGTGGTAGAALAAGSMPGSVAGKVGADGTNGGDSISGGAGGTGANGNATDKSVGNFGADGSDGGKGGDSNDGRTGGAKGEGGTGGLQTGTVYNQIKTSCAAYLFSDWQASTFVNLTGSAGTAGSGGGGGGGGSAAGGTGGGGAGAGGSGGTGGIIWVAAKTIILNGDITAYGGLGGNGGNGANGVDGNSGGGGGGGGGCGGTGGVAVVIYSKKTGAGTIVSPGGSGGTAGLYGLGVGAGTSGVAGIDGTAGNTGTAITLIV